MGTPRVVDSPLGSIKPNILRSFYELLFVKLNRNERVKKKNNDNKEKQSLKNRARKKGLIGQMS